jgi:hypothetical protein
MILLFTQLGRLRGAPVDLLEWEWYPERSWFCDSDEHKVRRVSMQATIPQQYLDLFQ